MMSPTKTRLLLALALIGLVGACSSARFADVANLNDPRTMIDEGADGGRVTLRRGNALVVRLATQSAAGYRWELQGAGDLASPIRADYAPAQGPATLPYVPPYGMALAGLNTGGAAVTSVEPVAATKPDTVVTDGVTVFRLRAVTVGTATLQVDYRNPADPAAGPARSVRFDVAVVP